MDGDSHVPTGGPTKTVRVLTLLSHDLSFWRERNTHQAAPSGLLALPMPARLCGKDPGPAANATPSCSVLSGWTRDAFVRDVAQSSLT